MQPLYKLVGYDKDADVYVNYAQGDSIAVLMLKAKKLLPLLAEGKLRRKTSDGKKEPIDWLEIVDRDYNAVWHSY